MESNSPAHLNMDSLLAHAESTSSTLNYLLLSVLGLSSSDTFAHAASHVGISQTLTTLLRALPYHASKGFMVIPASITAKNHVNQEDVFRHGANAAGIEDAVYEFAVVASDHLITARDMFKQDGKIQVPREAMPVFLGAVRIPSTQTQLHTLICLFERHPFKISYTDWKPQILMPSTQTFKDEKMSDFHGRFGAIIPSPYFNYIYTYKKL